MSAERKILHPFRGRALRKLAETSRPIIADALQSTVNEGQTTLRSSELFRYIGSCTQLFMLYGDKSTMTDPQPELERYKLTEKIDTTKTVNSNQNDVIQNALAPAFASILEAPPELFVRGYKLYSALICARPDSTFTTWPLAYRDMYLDGQQADSPTLFLHDAIAEVRENQPYAHELTLGIIGAELVSVDGTKPQDMYEKTYWQRMLQAGIGVASLQLQHMYATYEALAKALHDDYDNA